MRLRASIPNVPDVARHLSRTSSRRGFIGGTLKGAAALGGAMAFAGTALDGSKAFAFHTYPCGPSPICPGPQNGYMGAGGACPNGQKRAYNGTSCNSNPGNQCWLVGSTLCCDCCYQNVAGGQTGHTYNSCTNCGSGTWTRCINVFRCC